jgi:hypothetical protein
VSKDETTRQIVPEKTEAPGPEASNKDVDYIIRHASGRNYAKKKYKKPDTTPKD